MIAYKGFDKDLKCRGFQYKIGETYTYDGPIKVCESGFHACKDALDVLHYYQYRNGNRFCIVETDGDISEKKGEDSKLACSKLAVKAEITFAQLFRAGIEAVFKRVKAASGYYSTGAASGYYSTGAASGNGSTGAASGDYSTGAASGNCSTGAASGYCSTGAASGNYSTAIADGKNGIAVANGYKAKAKGALNNYLVLTEYDSKMNLLACKMVRVDGKRIKADTLYCLKDGKFVKAED